jgi:transaldolase
MTRLHELFTEQGQSPWLDNLNRPSLRDGGLARLVTDGVRGVTSNPTIFERAMTSSDAYDAELSTLSADESAEQTFWDLAIHDVAHACGILRGVHDDSGGTDGFVSLEVSPTLANDTEGTIKAARSLHERINLPNLMVKIPATAEGVPAIEAMIAEGRNINVTLIFSLERYEAVMAAYLSGVERWVAGGGDPAAVHSVASFFVSRVDTEVDRRLERVGAPGDGLAGQAAVAQARLAYELFTGRFSGPRWEELSRRGVRPQRPLWASTSTKNKAYPDLLYVDNLIGPNTVNTLPDATIEAFCDHGRVARTVDDDLDGARHHLDALAEVGVDMGDVAKVLEDEGVAAFVKSFESLLQSLTDKAHGLRSRPR